MTPSIRSIQATPAPRQSQAYADAVGVPPAEPAPEAVRLTAEQAELLLGDGIILQDPYGQPLAVFRAADLEAASNRRSQEENLTQAKNLLHLLECLVVNQTHASKLTAGKNCCESLVIDGVWGLLSAIYSRIYNRKTAPPIAYIPHS